MKTKPLDLITKAAVYLFVAATISCSMSNRPKKTDAPAVVEDSTITIADTTNAVALDAVVYPSDEEKDLWALVDSFRRTIDPINQIAPNRDDSLSESTIEALQAVGNTITKRTFALYTTMTLFGKNEMMSEAKATEFYNLISTKTNAFDKIRCYLTEIPKDVRPKLLAVMGSDIMFEIGADVPTQRSEYFKLKAADSLYHYYHEYISKHWPDFIEMCNEEGVVFEPHKEYMQVGDFECAY